MLISKPMAALIGGLFFAAIFGFIPAACDASAQSADYSVINPEQGQTTAERLDALESAARAAEIEALKQYEQADYDFMRGDAEIQQNQAAE